MDVLPSEQPWWPSGVIEKKTNSWYFIVIYLVICTVEQNGLYWAVIIWARFRRNWCFWCFVLIFIVFEIGGIGEIFVEHVGLCCWNVGAFVRCSHGRSCHFFWDCWHCWKVCSNRCCQLRLIQWGRWLKQEWLKSSFFDLLLLDCRLLMIFHQIESIYIRHSGFLEGSLNTKKYKNLEHWL